MQTPVANSASDPTILLNWGIPFDQNKINVLENVLQVMYTGSSQDVSLKSYLNLISL